MKKAKKNNHVSFRGCKLIMGDRNFMHPMLYLLPRSHQSLNVLANAVPSSRLPTSLRGA